MQNNFKKKTFSVFSLDILLVQWYTEVLEYRIGQSWFLDPRGQTEATGHSG